MVLRMPHFSSLSNTVQDEMLNESYRLFHFQAAALVIRYLVWRCMMLIRFINLHVVIFDIGPTKSVNLLVNKEHSLKHFHVNAESMLILLKL